MGPKYSNEALHPIRYMKDHISEVNQGDVSLSRTKHLKEQFRAVKALAYEIYKDAYILIIKLDEETMQTPEMLWAHEIQLARNFHMSNEGSYEKYSNESLHPIRHLEEYIQEIEEGSVSQKRREELKTRLGIVLQLSVALYFDAERLIRLLD